MAGAGYKAFADGDVLTAAQVQTYLQDQAVMRFADASARTSGLGTAVAEGMVSYLDDSNILSVYTGSVWESLQPPAGMISMFGGTAAPDGWLKANGAAVSRTAYALLFAAIGTAFGVGDGSTTFDLPDLRGEFLRGWDDARGVDSGRVFGSAQSSQNLAHTHTLTLNKNGANSIGFAGRDATPVTGTTSSSGGSEARPRNIAVLAIIKY